MLTRQCCCNEKVCCESWLTDQFVTIFGEYMNSAVPVSPNDLISLKINRPTSRSRSRNYAFSETPACKYCCTPGAVDIPNFGGPCTNCNPTVQCESCQNGGQTCRTGNQFASTTFRLAYGGPVLSCCEQICGGCNR